ncbi:MAG: cytochrome c [Candidatus Tectomicrobia bacterium]|uniref:Cytochrome c n=1 Tax=Tectimicrobiota bacterium TaxID=2528274 RepID=A0A932GR98_UNCTE|nr:cytochrome c [Candidatus Tectomicrobia bacterium]
MKFQRIKARIRFFPWVVLFVMVTAAGGCSGGDQTALETQPLLVKKRVSERVWRGKEIYVSHCAACHGLQGRGDGPNTDRLERPPRDFTAAEFMAAKTDDYLYRVIAGGGKSVGLSSLMPPWGKTLNTEEVWDLVKVLRQFSQSSPLDSSRQAHGTAEGGSGPHQGEQSDPISQKGRR